MFGYKKYDITIAATYLGTHEATIDIFMVGIWAKTSDDAIEKARNKWAKRLWKKDCIEFTLTYATLMVHKTLRVTGGHYSIKTVNTGLDKEMIKYIENDIKATMELQNFTQRIHGSEYHEK